MASRSLNETELDAYDVLPRHLAERVRIHQIPVLPGGYAGMTLHNRILLARPVDPDGTSALLAHELVHVRQWADQGLLRFAWNYVSAFVRNLARLRRWRPAYADIPAEQEARAETTDWLRRRARAAAEAEAGPDQDGATGHTGDPGHQG